MEIVERLAQALDDEDYVTAAECLDVDAEYDTGDQVIKGRDAILQSFKTAADSGRKTFDSVIFRHEISPNEPLDIRFIDILTRNGEEFVLDHTMHLTLSDRGNVRQLRLRYPLGERERLNQFLKGDSDGAGAQELTSSYATFLRQFADLYPDDAELRAQLQTVRVRREDWDDGRGGGHLYFEGASSKDAVDDDTFDALADDADGAEICIILHCVGGLLNWGEWFRWDGRPVQCWPPPSLRSTR